MNKKPKALSLFSGAMGLDLGIEKAGFEILACIENDKKCVETIKLNKKTIKVYPNDINEINPKEVMVDLGVKQGEIDLIVGGPPCQAFSTAGKQRSLNDFRGNVIIRFLDFVKDIKPKYFILENVRGIYYAKLANTPPEYQEYKKLEHIPGSVIYFLFKEFTKLGYSINFNLFDSSLYSVPQRRERFIMFGALSSKPVSIPSPTTFKNKQTLSNAILDIQNIHHDFIRLSEKNVKYLSLLKEGEYWKNLPEKLQVEAMGKSFYLSGGRTGFYRRLSWGKPSPTLVTHPTMPATMLIHPLENRPLSIQEYARIQQFPDEWLFAGNIIDKYKQIGNAVPVGLGYMAGLAVKKHMKNKNEKDYSENTSRYHRMSKDEFLSDFEIKLSETENNNQIPLTNQTSKQIFLEE